MKDLDRQRLHKFLFLPDSGNKADVTIVLGMTLWQRPAERAFELYRKGLSGRLIFTGGHNPNIDKTESQAMAQHALSLGVSQGDFLEEPRATNTRENFIYCRELMEEHGLLRRGCSLTIVTISFHMRRAVLTAQDIFAGAVAIGTASYPSIHYPDSSWHESPRGRRDALAEINKLGLYYPHSIPADVKDSLPGLA